MHGIAATPTSLLKALCDHVKENNLNKIKLHHLHIEGETPWTEPDVKGKKEVGKSSTASFGIGESAGEGVSMA